MKWLIVSLALWPAFGFAQTCGAPEQGSAGQTDMAGAPPIDTSPASGTWIRSGLVLSYAPPTPLPVIDQQTVAMQMCEGCAAGSIRHAPSAAMRQVLPDTQWSEDLRRLASASAVAEDFETASAYLSDASARVTGDAQRHLLQNLEIETALQFERHDAARRLIDEYAYPRTLSGPLLSDRLFWTAYTMSYGASAASWRSDILPLLEQAHQADPSSYQVRVWRMIGWLRAGMWDQYESCNGAVSVFSDIVLDTTEQAVCPLMLGHLSHTLERTFEMRAGEHVETELEAWHSFAEALLSTLVANQALRDRLVARLQQAEPSAACADQMASALLELREGLR